MGALKKKGIAEHVVSPSVLRDSSEKFDDALLVWAVIVPVLVFCLLSLSVRL